MEAQESPSVQSQFVTRTGTNLEELAEQCRVRFFLGQIETQGGKVLPKQYAPWEDLDINSKARWMEACEQLADFIGQEIESPWRRLAQRFALSYFAADKWDDFPEIDKLCFEVCCRHIVNMVTAEDQEDVDAALGYDWGEWLVTKLSG